VEVVGFLGETGNRYGLSLKPICLIST
jgi:hypothetical protein